MCPTEHLNSVQTENSTNQRVEQDINKHNSLKEQFHYKILSDKCHIGLASQFQDKQSNPFVAITIHNQQSHFRQLHRYKRKRKKIMASMPFSATFHFPHDFSQTKKNSVSSSLWPSMPFSIPSTKSSLGSSKSAFLQHGFSLQSLTASGFVFKSRSSGFVFKSRSSGIYARAAKEKTLYDYTVKDIDGKDVSLSKFKGKVLLIVNVASKCGLTTSNYSELSHIYEKYKTQGFEILAFPCNQFGGQEPGSNPEIKQFACTRFKAEFPIFDKVDVNGPNTAPVYQFLKSSAGGSFGDLIKWNFEKFLVDKKGKIVERYPPTTSPFQIEKDIQKLLAA
ncbi:phospholipid hydroperoxide glutathione peroxidase, chloroplastic-like [Durio zibethinus]|uniref:Glutathione peroxidase n=1 Tax=Durio zibethinus TaxID=66656 RepID=A0A6P5ZDB1_DURZI|nr:phospholipid hydroperoxide glutathione peroxidase, chloroplastic-like [Durio zibethinus]